MKVQTKLLPVLLVLIVIFGLTACGSSSGEPNSAKSKPSAESKANTIG